MTMNDAGSVAGLERDKAKFLDKEFFMATFSAMAQRGHLYSDDVPAQDKVHFRSTLRERLERLVTDYQRTVKESTHIKSIENLSGDLSRDFGKILKDERFRIGSAQKALNLYLKYLWCAGRIVEPPHCPFDGLIIAKLKDYSGAPWTQLVDIDDYRALVSEARVRAGGLSIANWELRIYNGFSS